MNINNVVFGTNPENGSDGIEDYDERVNFDGKNNPFFKEAIELIEKNLDLNKKTYATLHHSQQDNIKKVKCFFKIANELYAVMVCY